LLLITSVTFAENYGNGIEFIPPVAIVVRPTLNIFRCVNVGFQTLKIVRGVLQPMKISVQNEKQDRIQKHYRLSMVLLEIRCYANLM